MFSKVFKHCNSGILPNNAKFILKKLEHKLNYFSNTVMTLKSLNFVQFNLLRCFRNVFLGI